MYSQTSGFNLRGSTSALKSSGPGCAEHAFSDGYPDKMQNDNLFLYLKREAHHGQL